MNAALALVLAMKFLTTPAELIAAPAHSVTILDARGAKDYERGHIPGALRIDWKDYRNGWLRTGKLPKDLDRLAGKMAKLGVDESRPVVVYGKAQGGWGEEGRIVWMLAYLGHHDVSLLDGEWNAWVAAGGAVSTQNESALEAKFTAHPVAAMRAGIDDVEAARNGAATLLDVRSEKEWKGATPYFEARGGHVPGAVHLVWTDLLDDKGRVDAGGAKAKLAAAGVRASTPVITYCTGGVRSAEAWTILRALGFENVRNYDGSWYEWSADKKRPVTKE